MNGYQIQAKLDEALQAGRVASRAHYIVKAAIRHAQMTGRPVRDVADLERAINEYRTSGKKIYPHFSEDFACARRELVS